MVAFRIIYGTGEGQTAKVADRVAGGLRERGHEVEAVDVEDAPADLDPEAYDAVLVGSSIHVGKHHGDVVSFLTEHAETLSSLLSAFFQLSLSSTGDEHRRAEAAGYVDELLEATGWDPDRIGLFGGALRYSKYGFLERQLMKRIAAEATGDTDTSRDHEYTDWDEVDAYAADIAAFVDGRLGMVPPR